MRGRIIQSTLLSLTAALLTGMACRPAPAPAPSSTPSLPAPGPAVPAPAAPAPEPQPAQLAAPPAGVDRGCEVAVRTRVVALGEGRYELIARAGNETDGPIDAELSYDCPGTAARFDGLPPGYDLGNLCQAGACAAGALRRQRLVLPAGGSTELARVTLDTAAGPCNAQLPAGSYSIGASVRLLGAQSCSTSRGTFEHGAPLAQTPPARPPAQPRRPPAPARPAKKPCPAMACSYTPCPPGVKPPEGCASVCGCTGHELPRTLMAPPDPL